jgi:hypothetical protein
MSDPKRGYELVGRESVSDMEAAAEGSVADDGERVGMLSGNDPTGDPKAATPAHTQTSEWYHTSALLLADIIGTGILSLPGAFAKLGFVGGTGLLLVSYFLNLYTGILLARMKLWFPAARSYGILLGDAFGPRAKVYGYFVLVSYI